MEIEYGNINTKKNGDRNWIIGHFDQLKGTPFQTDGFEVKWSKHSKGGKKKEVKANKIAKTVSILVSGKFKIDFPGLSESHILKNEGDYVFSDPGVAHSWEALEDSLVISIRWPSVANDQV